MAGLCGKGVQSHSHAHTRKTLVNACQNSRHASSPCILYHLSVSIAKCRKSTNLQRAHWQFTSILIQCLEVIIEHPLDGQTMLKMVKYQQHPTTCFSMSRGVKCHACGTVFPWRFKWYLKTSRIGMWTNISINTYFGNDILCKSDSELSINSILTHLVSLWRTL